MVAFGMFKAITCYWVGWMRANLKQKKGHFENNNQMFSWAETILQSKKIKEIIEEVKHCIDLLFIHLFKLLTIIIRALLFY